MLSEWFKNNPVSKNKMLDVIKEWEEIEPFETDDICSLEAAVAKHGRRYVAYVSNECFLLNYSKQ